MKIRDVKTYRLDAVLAEPFAYSQAWYDRRGALLVEIVSDDGLSGWGEAFGPPPLTAPIVEFYKTLLVGADALATELHWQNLYNRLRDPVLWRACERFLHVGIITRQDSRRLAGWQAIGSETRFDHDQRLAAATLQLALSR